MARMFWVNKKNYQKLEAIGKKKGGRKPTQLVRVAIQEYIDRESETKKKAKRDKTRKPKR
jgi:metal-responsive CopG/Arc/MetJ family transcriptional regulator